MYGENLQFFKNVRLHFATTQKLAVKTFSAQDFEIPNKVSYETLLKHSYTV